MFQFILISFLVLFSGISCHALQADARVASLREDGEKSDGPAIVRGLRREEAAKDLLIGISLWAAGFTLGQVLGEETSDSPSGEKRLSVPATMVVWGFALVGTGFFLKGLVEICLPPENKPKSGPKETQTKNDTLSFSTQGRAARQ